MPRITGIREHFDHLLSETATIEPGRTITLEPDTDQSLDRYIIAGIGLRLIDRTRDEEDLYLDHFTAKIHLGKRVFGPWPGTVLSTFRQIYEPVHIAGDLKEPKTLHLVPVQAAGLQNTSVKHDRMAWATMPYCWECAL